MQQNEFEKQVKQMMDGFNPQPSDAVWQNISSRIDTGNRKKRRFAFWVLALVLITAGGVFLYNSANDGNKDEVIVNNENADSGNRRGEDRTPAQQDAALQVAPSLSDQTESGAVTEANIDVVTLGHTKQSLSLKDYSSRRPQGINTLTQPGMQVKTAEIAASAEVPAVNVTATADTLNKQPYADNPNRIADTATALPQVNNNVKQPLPDTTAVALQQHDSATIATKKIQQANTLPRWQWGITAAYGKSSTTGSLEKSMANASGPALGNGGSPGDNFQAYTASSAYELGVTAERRITKNGFIGAGINYTYLSTKSSIANSVDSAYSISPGGIALNTYYQPGDAATYTNKYHFLELPVYFKQDLFAAKKISFSYNAGFSLRQLISTNSLVYDSQSNLYNLNNSQLSKTQLQVQAGLNAKFRAGKNMAVYVGPQFSYSLTGLYKNNSNGNFHLMDYGLHLGLMFHK